MPHPIQTLPARTVVALVGGVILLILAVYVPWLEKYYEFPNWNERPAGYRLIFDPPQAKHGVRIDLVRWLVPMGVVLAVTVIGVIVTGRRVDPAPTERPTTSTTDLLR